MNIFKHTVVKHMDDLYIDVKIWMFNTSNTSGFYMDVRHKNVHHIDVNALMDDKTLMSNIYMCRWCQHKNSSQRQVHRCQTESKGVRQF